MASKLAELVSNSDTLASNGGALGVLVALLLGVPLLTAAVGYLFARSLLSTKSNKVPSLQVPRGNSWFLPVIGETFGLLFNADKFLNSRVKRYGEVFTTHVFGTPTVMVTGADSIKLVLASPHYKVFGPAVHMTRVIGPECILHHPAGTPLHSLVRRIVIQRAKGENVAGLISDIDFFATRAAESWAQLKTVSILKETNKYTFYVTFRSIFTDMKPSLSEMEVFRQQFETLMKGVFHLKINLPGTPYNKGLQARNLLYESIDKRVEQRKSAKVGKYKDMLEDLMNSTMPGPDGNPVKLTPSQIRENVLVILLGGTTTTASAITWLIKFLTENPQDLEEIMAEHRAIADSKDSKDYVLTYEDTLKMPASTRAFMETVRIMAPPVISSRVPAQDVTYQGQLIPEGWLVQVSVRPMHLNPKYYPEPNKFNPSRFKETSPQAGTYLPFGAGPRVCPASDLAKVQSIMLLHRLFLHNRLEQVGDNSKLEAWVPTLTIKGGLLVNIHKT